MYMLAWFSLGTSTRKTLQLSAVEIRHMKPDSALHLTYELRINCRTLLSASFSPRTTSTAKFRMRRSATRNECVAGKRQK